MFREILRRSPAAFNVIEGSLVTGKVLRVQKSGFLSVDIGFRGPQTMPVSELGHRVVTPGDTHTFYVENLETPLGDMELDANVIDRVQNTESVWNEIMTAYQKNSLVKGRVLNAVNAGYAVGIGGIVAFLPISRIHGEIRVGHLHDFKIISAGAVNDTRNLVVTCVEKGDLDAILRSRARLANSTAASEALLQKYEASRSVPRNPGMERKPRLVGDTGALLARVQAFRMRKEAMMGEGAASASTAAPQGAEAAAGATAGRAAADGSTPATRRVYSWRDRAAAAPAGGGASSASSGTAKASPTAAENAALRLRRKEASAKKSAAAGRGAGGSGGAGQDGGAAAGAGSSSAEGGAKA